MIVNPTLRICLFPADADAGLEIMILGEESEIANLYAQIRQLAEAWRGFDRVAALAQGGTVLGVRVTIAPTARYREPIVEGMTAIRTMMPLLAKSLTWRGIGASGCGGMIGTW